MYLFSRIDVDNKGVKLKLLDSGIKASGAEKCPPLADRKPCTE
jgi:hypothetical protein